MKTLKLPVLLCSLLGLTLLGCSRIKDLEWHSLRSPQRAVSKGAPPWLMLHGGPLHWGYTESEVVLPLKLHWVVSLVAEDQKGGRYRVAPPESSRPIAQHGTLFVGSHLRGLVALRWSDGRELWRYPTNTGVESTPAFVDNQLVFGTNDGTVYKVDAQDGTEIWHFPSGLEVLSSPTVAEGKVFFSNTRESLYAIDLETGEWLWQVDRPTLDRLTIRGTASPAVHEGRVYYGFFDGTAVALDAEDGERIWEVTLPSEGRFSDVDTPPLVIPELNQVVLATFGGKLYGLSLDSGEILWGAGEGGSSAAAYDGERIYWTDRQGKIVAIDPREDGKEIWHRDLDAGFLSSPVVSDKKVFVASFKPGKVFALDKVTGEIMEESWIASGIQQPPTIVDGNLFIVTEQGFLYRLRPRFSHETYTRAWE